ncbi:hypothetical protein [uncultured Tateyamaria sp.]|uniref:hypothetical protein n=1 Tax=uncultured Tateyamaria sp. TaxID=455651 RepID=UPI00261CE630|nr:hypothetical protein [uncultured Tateyamaria sp.]
MRTLSAALAVFTLSVTFAMADAPRLAAQKCAASTHAPGNYNISNAPGIPHVLPGDGGTKAGAASINDCLKDAYAVQYGTKQGTAAVAAVAPRAGTTSIAECDRIRRQNITTGVIATVGIIAVLGEPYTASAIGGAAGTITGVRGVNRRHRACVAAASATPVDPKAAIHVGCSRRGGVFSGGTRLCVAP